MENAMCIEASPSGISNRARARFYWLASVPGNVWWGGGSTCHYHHTRALVQLLSMCIVTILVGRILGFALFVIPMYPSQPFPFEQPSLYRDVRSSILDYTNPSTGVASHHLLACDANISLHFPKLREQENLRALEKKQEIARAAAFQQKLDKLTPVEDFTKCCSR